MDVKPAQFIKWTDDVDYPQVELAKQEAIDAVLWHIENLDLPSIVKGEVRPIMNNHESDSHAALQVVGSSMIASMMQHGHSEDTNEGELKEILFGTPDQSFHMVCGIWITPDFSKFERGKTPPTICHATTDFDALLHSIQALFPHSPPVAFQIPNDTVDIVTIQVRSQQPEATHDFKFCRDFAAVLLRMAKVDTSDVLDIRLAWETMHALPQRDASPPPVLIMFAITAANFVDAMIWLSGAGMSFSLRPTNPFGSDDDADNQQATLPTNFHAALEVLFGCAFERGCIFDRICSDPLPAAFRLH